MQRVRMHCRAISKVPAVSQSGLQIKVDTLFQVLDLLLSAQRQSPWKVSPFGNGNGTSNSTNNTTNSTGTNGSSIGGVI